jgi:DNA-binding GntR family transcriptional regulator
VRKAIDRGDAQGADKLIDYLRHSMKVAKSTPVEQLVALDEGFHMSIAELAGNVEFTRILQNLNERIRFVRWIDMENVGRSTTQAEHLRIAEAIRAQDRKAAVQSLESHIALRREQIVEAIKQGLTRIYLEDAAA